MRIAILSDLHIGYERFREDAFSQAGTALEMAAKEADAILIPGDIFDYRHPKPDVIAEGMIAFKRISGAAFKARVIKLEGRERYTDRPIVAIPGTHERRADGEIDAVDLLSLSGLLVNANKAMAVIEKGDEKVCVYGIGGVAEERFRETIKALNPRPVEGAFNIFFFHQSIYETLPFSSDFIHIEELPIGFDLYVCGHIHSRYEGKCHGKDLLIPGSTVLTQLKEGEQEEKGFFIYDTESRSYSFLGIGSRKFVNISIDVSGKDAGKINGEIERAVADAAGKFERPVVRVALAGEAKDRLVQASIRAPEAGGAAVEISKSGIKNVEAEAIAEEIREERLGEVSIKELGMKIFISRLKEKGYQMSIDPVELLEILDSEEGKEKVVSKAIEALLT